MAEEALAGLPTPQRRALEIALLIEEPGEEPTDERAVAVGALAALQALARATRLLVAIDDVQWLDPASEGVLRFAARRLVHDDVRLLVAQRVDGGGPVPLELDRAFTPDRVHAVRLGPLSLGAVQRLLGEHLERTFSHPALLRLHELSGGNPFFALELGRAFERGSIELTPGERLPATLDVLVRDRIEALPLQARRALTAAAAVSRPTLALVAAVAPDALAEAIETHVVELDGESIRFTHPLLASAAYAALPVSERREIQRSLATAVDDLEERARLLALASDEPDSEVARLLDDAAARAYGRGGVVAAADFASQALRLTPAAQADEAWDRTLRAAQYRFEAGESEEARALLDELIASAPAGPQRARAFGCLARMSNYIASPMSPPTSTGRRLRRPATTRCSGRRPRKGSRGHSCSCGTTSRLPRHTHAMLRSSPKKLEMSRVWPRR